MNFNILTYLAICLFAGLFGGKLVKPLKLPSVTGYLVIGILIGPYVLNLIPAEAAEGFGIVSEMALGFIAFSIGAEFKLDYLKKVGRAPVVIAILESFLAVVSVVLALVLFGQELPFALCLGAIAAATAPAATLMVVRQYKADGPVTQTLLPVVAIDDATALMFFGISVALAKSITASGDMNIWMTLLDPVVEIVGALVFGAVLGFFLSLLMKWFHSKGNRLSIAVGMVFLCVGVADMLGLSSLLSCMAMSAMFVNLSNAGDKVFSSVDQMTPPLFMLFFLLSGVDLNIRIIPTVGIVGIIYVIFRVIGKMAGTWVGARLSRAEPAVQKYLGFTLIPQAGVAIGLSGVVMAVVPEYGAEIRAIILCATVIYEITGPVITKLALTKAGEIRETSR
ncbi:MAG: cation:proton antiporter [Lachnospiraceae bacterium]|nr:cation:proton antiporter [Lachnospiraceae bacterium]